MAIAPVPLVLPVLVVARAPAVPDVGVAVPVVVRHPVLVVRAHVVRAVMVQGAVPVQETTVPVPRAPDMCPRAPDVPAVVNQRPVSMPVPQVRRAVRVMSQPLGMPQLVMVVQLLQQLRMMQPGIPRTLAVPRPVVARTAVMMRMAPRPMPLRIGHMAVPHRMPVRRLRPVLVPDAPQMPTQRGLRR